MILRRVIAHFRKQEWTAIGIDFVIVVIGVFVGIQVSNWNAALATDRQSRSVTARLLADLRDEAWSYRLLIEYNNDVLENAERALAALEGRLARNDEALLIAAYRATQYREPRRRRSTYDELISTGTIGLIRDRALRDTAVRVYTTPMFENIRREGSGSRYREAFRMSVPVEVQRALRDSCGERDIRVGDYTVIVDSLDYPCSTGLPPAILAEAAEALRAASLAPLLRLRISDIETRRADMLANNPDIRDGLLAIAKERP
jgi:hypothetical protein